MTSNNNGLVINQSEYYVEPCDRSNQAKLAKYALVVFYLIFFISLYFAMIVSNALFILSSAFGIFVLVIFMFGLILLRVKRAPPALIAKIVAIEGNPKLRKTFLNIVAADTGLYWNEVNKVRYLLTLEIDQKIDSNLVWEAKATGTPEDIELVMACKREELALLEKAKAEFEQICKGYIEENNQ